MTLQRKQPTLSACDPHREKKMNIKTLAILVSVFAQPAFACNYDLISMTGWKITPKDSDSNTLETAFVFNGDREIRMIDASAQFSDVLGKQIASFAVDRDLRLETGAVFFPNRALESIHF